MLLISHLWSSHSDDLTIETNPADTRVAIVGRRSYEGGPFVAHWCATLREGKLNRNEQTLQYTFLNTGRRLQIPCLCMLHTWYAPSAVRVTIVGVPNMFAAAGDAPWLNVF